MSAAAGSSASLKEKGNMLLSGATVRVGLSSTEQEEKGAPGQAVREAGREPQALQAPRPLVSSWDRRLSQPSRAEGLVGRGYWGGVYPLPHKPPVSPVSTGQPPCVLH